MDELNVSVQVLSHLKSYEQSYNQLYDQLYLKKKQQNVLSFVKIKPKKQLATVDVINAAKILIQMHLNLN